MDPAHPRTGPDDPRLADAGLGGPGAPSVRVVPATSSIDERAVRWTRPPREGDRIVLLLHGLGSTEDDLIGLAPALPGDLVYASLRGIYAYGPGWAWLDFPVDPARRERLSASAAAIEAWIDTLPAGRVVGAIGFSQGAALALELLRRRPASLAWVAQLSGHPFPGELPGDAELAWTRPPVLWGHGGQDPLSPPALTEATRAWMREHTQLTEELSPALGHGVDERVLAALAAFVAERTTTG